MAIGAVIRYKQNEIRLTAGNLVIGAFFYTYLAVDLMTGKAIFSYSHNNIYFAAGIFVFQLSYCTVSIILGLYQRQYNQRLTEAGTGINRWFLSERNFNYLTATAIFMFGFFLLTFPMTETHSGLATGGLFFNDQGFAGDSNFYWQLVYFHFALCILPLALGTWLLLFPPKKIH